MSEYMRALKLQKDNFIDDALSLFSELLQTEILFEVNLLSIYHMIWREEEFFWIEKKLFQFWLGDKNTHIKNIDNSQVQLLQEYCIHT